VVLASQSRTSLWDKLGELITTEND
jgi:hypothetical protein